MNSGRVLKVCRQHFLDFVRCVVLSALASVASLLSSVVKAFVYAVCVSLGYFSWRNSAKGSWFIQALHRMLERYGKEIDFVKLLTRVNYEVAYEFESNAAQAHMTRKKQIPSIVSMLTKDLYLTAK